MTKLTWDNAVHLSPATAKQLNISNQDRVELNYRGNKVEASVWISPGQPENSATVHLGWGRWHAGRAGNGAGFNAYVVAPSDALWSGSGLHIRKIDKDYPLATTQLHQSMEGRDLILSATAAEYKNDPDFVSHETEQPPKGAHVVSAVELHRVRVGHVDRPDRLRRLQRLRGRVPG